MPAIYQAFGVPVADVAGAFRIADSTPLPRFGVPVNVLLTFVLTWMGAPPPIGPDIHPNAIGYAVIVGAFVNALEAP